jgi:hypothetical protein
MAAGVGYSQPLTSKKDELGVMKLGFRISYFIILTSDFSWGRAI